MADGGDGPGMQPIEVHVRPLVCYGPAMLEMDQIAELALNIGRRRFGARAVKDVLTEPDVTAWGDDAVRVTFVIGDRSVHRLTGEAQIKVMMDLSERLDESGGGLTPKLRYATPSELAAEADADPEC
jgi:hypothetical protein